MATRKKILNEARVNEIIDRLSSQVMERCDNLDNMAIVGIHTRGVPIGKAIQKAISSKTGKEVPLGILDITFYRDDLGTRNELPEVKETLIHFDITDMDILLVDDVLFTGRSTKAALETLMSFGRPRTIRLLVLVDRGHRDLPIQPDFYGIQIETSKSDLVQVLVSGPDEETGVFVSG